MSDASSMSTSTFRHRATSALAAEPESAGSFHNNFGNTLPRLKSKVPRGFVAASGKSRSAMILVAIAVVVFATTVVALARRSAAVSSSGAASVNSAEKAHDDASSQGAQRRMSQWNDRTMRNTFSKNARGESIGLESVANHVADDPKGPSDVDVAKVGVAVADDAVAVADDNAVTHDAAPVITADNSPPAPKCPVGSRIPSIDEHSLHSMFTRLSSHPDFAHLRPSVMSRGGPTSDDAPWALVLDDFLSPSELDAAMGHLRSPEVQAEFYKSVTVNNDPAYRYRRSETMGCRGECLGEPWIRPLVERMTEVVGLGMRHAEDISLTHYSKGGFYGRHHDYIPEVSNPRSWQNCGNRILTFLVYLNDVEEGGATGFFHLGIDVKPKAGRALIFPDVFPDKPTEKDERTAHEAKVVEKGEKYIAQTWFFLYDYGANLKAGCCA